MAASDWLLRCRHCGANVIPALTICPRCGEVGREPEPGEEPRVLVVRRGPEQPAMRRQAEALLTDAGDGLDGDEARRQLALLPAAFPVEAPDAMLARLASDLERMGWDVAVRAGADDEQASRRYWHWLTGKVSRWLPPLAAAVGAVVTGAKGHGWWFAGLGTMAWIFLVLDIRAFRRALTLRGRRLARKLDVVPDAVVAPFGALLRGPMSDILRSATSGVLIEHGLLLDELREVSRDFPGVAGPLREALARMAASACRLAEKAGAIERAGNFADPQLDNRLQELRGKRSQEIEARLLSMDVSRQARTARGEWLAQVHATLVVRIETMAESLRTLRQRALSARVADVSGASGEAALDGLLMEARRELAIIEESASELDQVQDRLRELAALDA